MNCELFCSANNSTRIAGTQQKEMTQWPHSEIEKSSGVKIQAQFFHLYNEEKCEEELSFQTNFIIIKVILTGAHTFHNEGLKDNKTTVITQIPLFYI